jgi:hypothetical protein
MLALALALSFAARASACEPGATRGRRVLISLEGPPGSGPILDRTFEETRVEFGLIGLEVCHARTQEPALSVAWLSVRLDEASALVRVRIPELGGSGFRDFERTVELALGASEQWPLEIAVALDELVRAFRGQLLRARNREIAPPTAPPASVRAPDGLHAISARVALDFFEGGQTYLGPELAYTLIALRWLAISVAAGYGEGIPNEGPRGRVESRLFALELSAGINWLEAAQSWGLATLIGIAGLALAGRGVSVDGENLEGVVMGALVRAWMRFWVRVDSLFIELALGANAAAVSAPLTDETGSVVGGVTRWGFAARAGIGAAFDL